MSHKIQIYEECIFEAEYPKLFKKVADKLESLDEQFSFCQLLSLNGNHFEIAYESMSSDAIVGFEGKDISSEEYDTFSLDVD